MNVNEQQTVEFVNSFEPYLYHLLTSLKGKHIAVQTTRSTIQGNLTLVTPDHITIDVSSTSFYIRSKEIVWITEAR